MVPVPAVAGAVATACAGASSLTTHQSAAVLPGALASAVTRTLNASSIKATEVTDAEATPATTTFIYQAPDRVETDLANGVTVVRIGTATYANIAQIVHSYSLTVFAVPSSIRRSRTPTRARRRGEGALSFRTPHPAAMPRCVR